MAKSKNFTLRTKTYINFRMAEAGFEQRNQLCDAQLLASTVVSSLVSNISFLLTLLQFFNINLYANTTEFQSDQLSKILKQHIIS